MALIISAEEVAAVLAISINDADVARAQSVIEIVTDVDLTSPNPLDRFSADDLRRLRLAVQWQVAFLDAHPDALVAAQNVAAVSTNGSSITFATAVADGYLSPLAVRVLDGLSWVARFGITTLRPAARSDYERQPDPWVRIR